MKVNQLSKLPVLMRLPAHVLADLVALGRFDTFMENEIVCRSTQPLERVFWIMNGQVKTSVAQKNDDDVVIDILSKGSKIGFVETFEETDQYSVTATALDQVEAFSIAADDLHKLTAQHFELQMAVFANISAELRLAVKEINDLKLKNTAIRLGTFLLGRTQESDEVIEIELPFDKRLMAARLSMKPESLSRAFAKLKPLGVQTKGASVILTDVQVLRHYCGEDDVDV
ncbi:MAG: cyclic nucleotide-binding domain-containing protein [Methylocystaceae bacterium]|nr:cyclic nucleotide-binding domain-containing protein [Methylocystaceae bacterium]